MKLILLGFDHKTNSVAEREALAVSPSQLPLFLKSFLTIPGVAGIVFLSTCNRVELYATLRQDLPASLLMDHWKNFLGSEEKSLQPAYIYSNERAFYTLVRVASGLNSMALGENQILGQVKQAYLKSLELKVTDSLLNFAFQQAFRVAKKIRTDTGIAKFPTSVSLIAIQMAEQIFGNFKDLTALVVGTGEVGRQTAESLSKKGVGRLLVTNRTLSSAQEIATTLGAQAFPFAQLENILPLADLVITSTTSHTPILSKKMLAQFTDLKRESPLGLIDLGVPRDIAPEVGHLPGVYLYNMDDLKSIAEKNLSLRKNEAVLAEELLTQAVACFLPDWEKRKKMTNKNLFIPADLRFRSVS